MKETPPWSFPKRINQNGLGLLLEMVTEARRNTKGERKATRAEPAPKSSEVLQWQKRAPGYLSFQNDVGELKCVKEATGDPRGLIYPQGLAMKTGIRPW